MGSLQAEEVFFPCLLDKGDGEERNHLAPRAVYYPGYEWLPTTFKHLQPTAAHSSVATAGAGWQSFKTYWKYHRKDLWLNSNIWKNLLYQPLPSITW